MAEHVSGGLSLDQLAERMQSDMAALHTMEGLSPGLQDMVDSPAPGAMLRQLERFGVTPFVPEGSLSERPEESFSQLMEAGADAMAANGVPEPHLEDYYAAAEIAEQTGIHMGEVLDGFEAVRPQEVGVPAAEGSISTLPTGDTVALDVPASAMEGVEAQDYRDYDVHFMMYPLGHDILGTGLETRPSHAFIIVTEAGVDPLSLDSNSPEILLAARAGPDDGKYDGRPDENVQSPTEKGRDGDVYVADSDASAADIDAGGVRLIRTTTISGDIEDIRDTVEGHRRFINGEDVNYNATWRNSNTYAGDVYELLTGQEPPNTIQWPHYMPALGQDLVNYEDTEYANDFD